MEIKPPVAIAIITAVVVALGFFLWTNTGKSRYSKPPPIVTGAPLQPGAAPAGQAGAGPQIQTGAPMAPAAPPPGAAPGAEYRK